MAMKVIPVDHGQTRTSAGARAQEAAIAEAAILKDLRHPHIVRCEDVSLDPERQAVRLLLEYMDGGDLHGLIERQREEIEGFGAHFPRRVLAAVGGALSYVHSRGVLHRDVKPANVLLSKRSQRIKLADFGIAKLVETATLQAQTVVGTPYYFSPEIVSGEAYGPPSDSWALGATLYEVAALRRPFEASNQLALVRQICEKSPAPLPPDTSGDIQAVVEGLLLKDPAQRMVLAKALSVNAAVAALVVSSSAAEDDVAGALEHDDLDVTIPGREFEQTREEEMSDKTLAGAAPGETSCPPSVSSCSTKMASSGESWSGAERVQTPPAPTPPTAGLWTGQGAAAAARAALGAEVDDPEELCAALAWLERESSDASLGGSIEHESALESLSQELRVRLDALREDANEHVAALLSELLADESRKSKPASTDGCAEEGYATLRPGNATLLPGALQSAAEPSSQVSTPRGGDMDDGDREAEEAIEVATTLGVDTGPVEEHLASVRRMLSLRVVWGEAVRFSLLPLRATYASVLREVLVKFSLPVGTSIRLSWCEGSEVFPLDGESSWHDCLQRRGLTENPGRLELLVQGNSPPRRRPTAARTMRPAAARTTQTPPPAPTPSPGLANAGLLVMGAQALPLTTQSKPTGERVAARTHATRPMAKKATSTDYRTNGKAWAIALGRDQPIHWAPGATAGPKAEAPHPPASPDVGLCLDVRGATIQR